MSLFGETVDTPGPDGERPKTSVPARPPSRYRRPALVVLTALAIMLAWSVVEATVPPAPPPAPPQL
jgi:hypothetical protein